MARHKLGIYICILGIELVRAKGGDSWSIVNCLGRKMEDALWSTSNCARAE